MSSAFACLGCWCGGIHEMSAAIRAAIRNIAAGMPETIAVSFGGECWLVPRLYMAAHELRASEVPELARRHGWRAASAE